jgi:hypothetical protein
MSATPATEPKTARLRWVSRVIATLTAVAGIGVVSAGQGFAATTITVDSIYFDTTVSDHQEGVKYTSWGGSGTGGPQIATFTDSAACTGGTCQLPADFTARILWGDGTTPSFCTAPFPADCSIGPATQSGNAGTYKVTASHAFVDEKNGVTGTGQGFNVQVIANDVADAGEGPVTGSNLANGGIWVQDQCLGFLDGTCSPTSQPAESFSASAGSQFTKQIANFQDANQLVDPTDTAEYSISINWADGTAVDTTTGTFAINTACGSTPGLATGSGCPVSISGTHTYATAGTRVVKVTIKDGLNPIVLHINTTAIVSANGPACTNAGLTSVPTSSQQSGTIITFTATSSTCTSPEYLFYVQATGGPWILGRGYGNQFYVWNTAGNGVTSYNVDVWVRQKLSGVSQQSFFLMPFTLTTPQACTSGGITAAPSSPQPSGTTITFTGTASTCSQPVFLFYVQATGGPWILGRTWGFGPYLWKTTGNGKTTYNIDVWIRQNGSKSAHETFAVLTAYRLI